MPTLPAAGLSEVLTGKDRPYVRLPEADGASSQAPPRGGPAPLTFPARVWLWLLAPCLSARAKPTGRCIRPAPQPREARRTEGQELEFAPAQQHSSLRAGRDLALSRPPRRLWSWSPGRRLGSGSAPAPAPAPQPALGQAACSAVRGG